MPPRNYYPETFTAEYMSEYELIDTRLEQAVEHQEMLNNIQRNHQMEMNKRLSLEIPLFKRRLIFVFWIFVSYCVLSTFYWPSPANIWFWGFVALMVLITAEKLKIGNKCFAVVKFWLYIQFIMTRKWDFISYYF